MKICQLCAVDFTLYHFLLPLMQGIRGAGHEVVGICSDGPLVERVRAAGHRVETVPIARSYNIASHLHSYRNLVALFRRERFDIVHVHTPVAALIGRLAAWRAGVPRIVYTAHGFYFHDRMAWPARAAFILLEWLAGRVTDILLTQAAEDAETAVRYRLCRGGAIEAIGNGVDPGRLRPAASEAERDATRARIGTPAEAVVIMMVGRLVSEKGYPELFRAMRALPGAELWVVGERLASDHAATIDQAIDDVRRDPDLGPRVRFLGYRDDVPVLLRAADVFVLPSHREGMPRSILEAMMTGLPVVATDIRGAREEVAAEDTGLLVPVGDAVALAAALRRLVGDGALRARMGDSGRERALSLFDETKIVARQLAILGLVRRREDGRAHS